MDAVAHFSQPSTMKGLQEFVGMVNFYRRFIPEAAQLMLPLSEAFSTKSKTLVWNSVMMHAFQATKKALAEATLLAHPCHDAPTSITADAGSGGCPPTARRRQVDSPGSKNYDHRRESTALSTVNC